MMKTQSDLTALVGARICHDLISPLGAIGNGVELLELTGIAQTPEMSLISESVTAAQTRIRFFGIAFGRVGTGLPLGRSEIAGILDKISRGGRLTYDWKAEGDVERPLAKALFLLLQCLESAMPLGGNIHVTQQEQVWILTATGDRMSLDKSLWNSLQTGELPTVTPAQVQFALLPPALAALGRHLSLTHEPRQIRAQL